MALRGLLAIALCLVVPSNAWAQQQPPPSKSPPTQAESPAPAEGDEPDAQAAPPRPPPKESQAQGEQAPAEGPPPTGAAEPTGEPPSQGPAEAKSTETPEESPAPTPQPTSQRERAPAQSSPPPPTYGQLGGSEPEPEAKEGDWDPWEHATPYQRRHDGFYLRLAIGFGGGAIAGDDHVVSDVDEVTISGGGLGTSIGIGGALVDNLILHGDLYQMTAFSPTVERDGREVGSERAARFELGVGDDARMGGVGLGLAYYFMPINLYLSGSVGFGRVTYEDASGDVGASEVGFGSNLMIGKEWWVASDWGMGLAGQFIIVAADDEVLGDVTALGLSVMFSATYN